MQIPPMGFAFNPLLLKKIFWDEKNLCAVNSQLLFPENDFNFIQKIAAKQGLFRGSGSVQHIQYMEINERKCDKKGKKGEKGDRFVFDICFGILYGSVILRQSRIILNNCPHHIIQRGHNRQVVTAGDEDYLFYLDFVIFVIFVLLLKSCFLPAYEI